MNKSAVPTARLAGAEKVVTNSGFAKPPMPTMISRRHIIVLRSLRSSMANARLGEREPEAAAVPSLTEVENILTFTIRGRVC